MFNFYQLIIYITNSVKMMPKCFETKNYNQLVCLMHVSDWAFEEKEMPLKLNLEFAKLTVETWNSLREISSTLGL